MRSLDLNSISILIELVEEEKERFSAAELKAIDKFVQLKQKGVAGNEVKPEFLLSFN